MIVSGTHVRRAALLALQTNLPGWLEHLSTPDLVLPQPRTWRRLADFADIAEHDSPAVLVTSPGIEGTPERDADGEWTATWLIRAFCVVRGRSYEETADRVGLYTAALRGALLDDRTLGGLALGVQRRTESLTELRSSNDRTVGAGSVTVAYTVTDDLLRNAPTQLVSVELLTDLIDVPVEATP